MNSLVRVRQRSSPTAVMHRPTAAAMNTTASTAVLLLKAVVMLEGTMSRITFRGFEPEAPVLACIEPMEVVNRPALNSKSPTVAASSSAKKEQSRNQHRVLKEMRPRVRVSEMAPMASAMEVNTIGTMTSCSARMNIWPMM